MRLGVPLGAGRIGKRVRIPRGRATVKIVAFEATMQKPGDLPGRSCSFRTPRARVFRPRGNSLLRKDPVASLSLLRDRKGDGILSFQSRSKQGSLGSTS